MATARQTRTDQSTATDADLLGAAENMAKGEQPDKGLLSRIAGKVKEAFETNGVQIGDDFVTHTAAQLIHERGMRYLGADIAHEVLARNVQGERAHWQRYNPTRHAPGAIKSERFIVDEYLFCQTAAPGQLKQGEKPPQEIHLVRNRKWLGSIGQHLARSCAERIGLDPSDPAVGQGDAKEQPVVEMSVEDRLRSIESKLETASV